MEITLQPRDFALITEEGKCVIEPGEFVITIGGQQPDARSTELTGKTVDSFHVTLTGETTEVEF